MEPANDTRIASSDNVSPIALTPEIVERVIGALLAQQDGALDALATSLVLSAGCLPLIAHDLAYRAVSSAADVVAISHATRCFARSLKATRYDTMLDLERCAAMARLAHGRKYVDDVGEVLAGAADELDTMTRRADARGDVAVLAMAAAEIAQLRAEHDRLEIGCSECDDINECLCEACTVKLEHEVASHAGYCADRVTLAAYQHLGEEHARRYVALLESAVRCVELSGQVA